ncbi:ComF family protein [Paenibacillus thalictri]|uniref:ComF family protein n=1 Tax=Paenibacillus thalictri TaxID=2527873 RepID=UPI0013EF1B5D|nr:ComF family protein [Paenibacillus thalictri]
MNLCAACSSSIPWIREVKCPVCGRYEPCYDCDRRSDTFFVHNRSAVKYDPMMKELLASYKYRGNERLRPLMGAMLMHAYALHKSVAPHNDVIWAVTYVPLSETRLMERGFNQAQQMAEHLAECAKLPVFPLLRRARHTDKQSFKSRGDRLHDMRGAFIVEESTLQQLRELRKRGSVHLLIVDDVYTTGSTLNQCAEVICGAIDIPVYGICWSR